MVTLQKAYIKELRTRESQAPYTALRMRQGRM